MLYCLFMVTQKDIADRLGVSQPLVSKVLNDRLGTTNVRPDVVGKIRQTAIEMGYFPHAAAQALVRGRQGVIAAFLRRIGQPGSGITESLAEGIFEQAGRNDLRMLMSFCTTYKELIGLCSLADRHLVDGLIVGGHVGGDIDESILPELLAIQQSGIPVITAFHDQAHPSLPNVGNCGSEIGHMATQHLIERGCRSIAHLNSSMIPRFEGYKAALRDHGLEVRPELIWSAKFDFSHQVGEQAVTHWLDAGIEFDGLVAQCDEQAVGAINALIARGRRVPDDVRIVGIDDAPYCEFCSVTLSSVSQSFDAIGRRAVEMLLQAIEDPGRPIASVNIPPVLHPRRSSQ